MIDRKRFFDTVRNEFGKLSQPQVGGFNLILEYWEDHSEYFDGRWLAYILATAWHESAHTMQPIEEIGKGKGRYYGVPNENGKVYYGRGLVQITLEDNYLRIGNLIGVNLVEYPELALVPDVSVKILVEGMCNGWFTGKKLSDYFNDNAELPVNARRIVNGTDKASLISKYYYTFKKAILG